MAKRIAVSFVGYEGAGQTVNTTVPSVTGASDSSTQSNDQEYESFATYSSFRPKPLDVFLQVCYIGSAGGVPPLMLLYKIGSTKDGPKTIFFAD